MKKIILASRSVDRSELLRRAKIPFEIIFSNINESYYKKKFLNPYDLVKELAKAKVLDVKQKVIQTKEDALIIAADTIVELNGIVIGKANSKEQAVQILKKLSNKVHNLITGFAITDVIGSKLICGYDQTLVYFSNITEREINHYIESNEWMGRAGAYSIRDKAVIFIDSIEGSYSNVIGLPLNKIFKILKKEFNLNLLEL